MTSFSEICESSRKWEFWRTQTGTLERKMLNQLSCLERYVLMVRDNIFPALLACAVCDDQDSHYDKRVKALIQKALAQLEDM